MGSVWEGEKREKVKRGERKKYEREERVGKRERQVGFEMVRYGYTSPHFNMITRNSRLGNTYTLIYSKSSYVLLESFVIVLWKIQMSAVYCTYYCCAAIQCYTACAPP